jgi:phospholipid-binding lipoprotein MlaA
MNVFLPSVFFQSVLTVQSRRSFIYLCAGVFFLLSLSGCASLNHNPDDPWEAYNRGAFSFNEQVDRAVLKPLATAYDTVTPRPFKIAVGNFFSNLGDVWIGANNLLQGKVADGLSDWMRFLFNSTFGLAGVLDIASEAGLKKHDEDFGQTLAVWGVGEGRYVVLPFFGGRTLRDAVVMPLDMKMDTVWQSAHIPTRNVFRATRLVHVRSTLLGVTRTLDRGTLDRYAFTRDFYLQQRRNKVNDGRINYGDDDFSDIEASAAGNVILARTADNAAIGALRLNLLVPHSAVFQGV